jgi:ABC-type sugar transport system, permease component
MSRLKRRIEAFDVINFILLSGVIFLLIYPVYYIVINSLSDSQAVSQGKVAWYPIGASLDAYKSAFNDDSIVRGFLNAILYTSVGTCIKVVLTAMCAYPLSRADFFGKKPIMAIIVFTMFFSGGMIPLYLTVNSLHLINSMWAVILPFSISVFNLLVMRTFFQGIPFAMTEAAYIDGANDLTIFRRVILPLSRTIIATMILFYAVEQWNSYFYSLIFLTDKEKYPIQVIIRNIVIQGSTGDMTMGANEGAFSIVALKSIKYAVITAVSLPVMVVYPFIFKYFEKGVMIGSVKG